MDGAQNHLTRRLFDLGVAAVIVVLVAVLLYIAWGKYWELHTKYITQPRLAKEKAAAEKARKAQQEADRVKAERAGETLALGILTKQGYAFHARNQEAEGTLLVDGKPEPYRLKADLIVSKDGVTYVAEAKGGSMGTSSSVRHGPTRRQLLEYSILFKSTAVLLVDTDAKNIQRIDFPKYKVDPKPVVLLDRKAMITTLLSGLAFGAALALTIVLWLIPLLRSLWPALVPAP